LEKEYMPYWPSRGRFSGGRGSGDKRIKTLEYMALLAVKNNIDPGEFLNSIVEAWKKDESQCKQLTIRCRQRTKDSAIFSFAAADTARLSQFSIMTTILQGNESQLEPYVKTIAAWAPSAKKTVEPKIKDLRAGMKKVNLRVKVLEFPEPNVVYTRSRIEARIANILVGDETGTIRMSLWNEQVNMVSKDDVIEIENGEVANYRGELQLRIGRSGNLNVVERT
jgi:replication factor A1